jgi:hypothetical protein
MFNLPNATDPTLMTLYGGIGFKAKCPHRRILNDANVKGAVPGTRQAPLTFR